MSSSPVFAVDASSGGKVRLLATANKLQVRASEIESKLDTLNTTCGNINVSVGDVDVNTDGLETLQTAGNASLASVDGKITACNTGAVVVSSSALPSGGATSVLQSAGNTSIASVDGKITACNTGAVVVSSSALPSGGATSALQTTGNSSLSDILSELQTPSALATEASLSNVEVAVQDVDGSIQSLEIVMDDVKTAIENHDSKLDDIVTNTGSGSAPDRTVSSLASAQSVSDGDYIGDHNASENIDMSSHKTLVISGTTSVSGSIEMYVSHDSGSTYFFANEFYSDSNHDSTSKAWYQVIEHASGYVKFKWVGGSTSTITFNAVKQDW